MRGRTVWILDLSILPYGSKYIYIYTCMCQYIHIYIFQMIRTLGSLEPQGWGLSNFLDLPMLFCLGLYTIDNLAKKTNAKPKRQLQRKVQVGVSKSPGPKCRPQILGLVLQNTHAKDPPQFIETALWLLYRILQVHASKSYS